MSQEGSFGTFLSSLKRNSSATPAVGAASVIGILKKEEHHSLPLSDLYEKSGLNFSSFSTAVSMFQRDGFIDIAGVGGEEQVSLTPLAQRFELLHAEGG